MTAVLRLALVLAYLAAAGLPCAARDARAPSLERMRAYAAGALHAHGAAAASAHGELRAPCPCGCDEAPAAASAAGPLGVVLLPAALRPRLPRAAHTHATPARACGAPAQLPDPVPRLA